MIDPVKIGTADFKKDVKAVSVYGEKGPAAARAYALDPQFEDRLSSSQRANRAARAP